VNVKKINERPDEVKRVIRALIKANRFIRTNREGSIQVLTEWGRTTRENASASYDSTVKVFNHDGSIPDDGLRLVLEQAKEGAKLARDISAGEVADLTILRQAQKELGAQVK
jgi:ABC-type nitrate/sulfonate/bicarbonate transport system substrate-binding protein